MDEAASILSTLQCPTCHSDLIGGTGSQQRPGGSSSSSSTNNNNNNNYNSEVLVRYTNEGGIQEGLDIMPSFKEEAYLQVHPEAAPARAFHVMCAEGDIDGAFELLYHASEQVPDVGAMVRYQDPLSGMKSGLHLAVEHQHEGVVWLLLWLSSHVPLDAFPADARHAAESLGLGRLSIGPGEDIRALQDDRGKTAAEVAGEVNGCWLSLVETGLLNP